VTSRVSTKRSCSGSCDPAAPIQEERAQPNCTVDASVAAAATQPSADERLRRPGIRLHPRLQGPSWYSPQAKPSRKDVKHQERPGPPCQNRDAQQPRNGRQDSQHNSLPAGDQACPKSQIFKVWPPCLPTKINHLVTGRQFLPGVSRSCQSPQASAPKLVSTRSEPAWLPWCRGLLGPPSRWRPFSSEISK